MAGIIFILLVVASIAGVIWCRQSEKEKYNKGMCPVCGTKLVLIDNDRRGSKLYHCNKCGYSSYCSHDINI